MALRALAPRVAPLDTRSAKPPPKTADPFYLSPEWRGVIADLKAQGRGQRCEDPHCATPGGRTGCRMFGDHVDELQDGGAPLDPANVVFRCGSCHSRKTAAVRAARQRGW